MHARKQTTPAISTKKGRSKIEKQAFARTEWEKTSEIERTIEDGKYRKTSFSEFLHIKKAHLLKIKVYNNYCVYKGHLCIN